MLEAGTGRGDLPFQVRAEHRTGTRYLTAGRGFAMPNAGPGVPMRDAAYGVTTEADAREKVRELAAKKPDLIKIWVDDRNGTVEKLKPTLYRAIIDEAHAHGIRVMAHIATLADAKDLLRAGVDGFGHCVRDKDVDDELVAMLRQRPTVFFLVTLWGERNGIAEKTESAERLLRNVAALHRAGVTIGLGTDTGGVTGGGDFGFASHMELEFLVRAGMSPAEAIAAGTRTAARILGLDRVGTIAAGQSADFLVLDANPLDAIANTRKIARVYLRGSEIDRSTHWPSSPIARLVFR